MATYTKELTTTVAITGSQTKRSGTRYQKTLTTTVNLTGDILKDTLSFMVRNNRQAILFGGQNDTRVFMWGKGNQHIYSELADGLPSAEYFPESNSVLVGSDNYDTTAMTKQYDRLIIHKENESHYSTYENSESLGTIFSVFPLNDKVGNVAFGESRLIENNPFVVSDGVYEFVGSNVRDERNVNLASKNIQLGLEQLDLTSAVTFDWEKNFEYWIAIGTTIYVYNYKVGAWYKFILIDTPTCFIEIDGECYFGTSAGEIMKFDTTKLTDNGTAFESIFETGYLDFGDSSIRKFLTYGWFAMEPEGRSYCEIDWITDIGSSPTPYELEYNNIDFGNLDFGDFSFSTSYSPKPFRRKIKAKKFSMIKIQGKNSSQNQKMTILGLTLPAVTGGQVK